MIVKDSTVERKNFQKINLIRNSKNKENDYHYFIQK